MSNLKFATKKAQTIALAKSASEPLLNNMGRIVFRTTNIEETKEANMYTESDQQRRYLTDRLYTVYNDKVRAARKHFHIDEERPTLKAAIERLQKGDFKLTKHGERVLKYDAAEDFDLFDEEPFEFESYALMQSIDWRTVPADDAGFDAAYKAIQKARDTAQDAIKVLDPKDGLTAFQTFESATFH